MEHPLELPSGTLFIALFAGDLDPSKRNYGLSMGFLRRHSVCDVQPRGLLQVKLQFFVEIDRVLARHEETQTSQEFSHYTGPLNLPQNQRDGCSQPVPVGKLSLQLFLPGPGQ